MDDEGRSLLIILKNELSLFVIQPKTYFFNLCNGNSNLLLEQFDVKAFLANALDELFTRRNYSEGRRSQNIEKIATDMIAQEYTDKETVSSMSTRQLELMGVPGAFIPIILEAAHRLTNTGTTICYHF